MMKTCELCSRPARLHCEADGAWLCSHCDEKVHSANFLVGKHSRALLCRVCQSKTPWTASGSRIGAAICVCVGCASNQVAGRGEGVAAAAISQGYSEEKEGENQVVPWSPETPPPATTSDSGCENESTNKRLRDCNHEDAGDDEVTSVCCSPAPAKKKYRRC
ncbi:B-box zinc finger protein 32-like [Impatiens glandulifera]|uniref:B-box zinc finger protein 32-like n=1 Tax=Impatiens glandulifera TaxID=253017 RepID=UPI001FB07440|nr:B-box zinc finger protein 32-like [Impatiens glandulifera]